MTDKEKQPTDAALLKPVSNFIMINFTYGLMVLPYKQGVELIKNMENAEMVDSTYFDRDTSKIHPIPRDEIRFTVLNRNDYLKAKRNTILGVNKDAC